MSPSSERLRILVLSWKCKLHEAAGGAETYTHEVMERWTRWGHAVTLFCAASPGLPQTDTLDGVNVIRRGGRFTVYREAARFYEEIRPGTFDVVVDTINTRPFLSPSYVRDAPVVALAHQVAREVWFETFPPPISALGRYWFEPRWLTQYRDVPVLTVSASSAASLRAYALRNITVIGMGLRPPPACEARPRAMAPRVVFLGRLAPNKQPSHAVAAFAKARREIKDLELLIAGTGPLERRLAASLPTGARMLGRLSEEAKAAVLGSAHALLVPSVREGWGMVVSEAASVGTRSIGYDVAGLRDSVPPADGVLVEPKVGALASAIETHVPRWAALPRPNLGLAGCRSWDEVAEDFLRHLRLARHARF